MATEIISSSYLNKPNDYTHWSGEMEEKAIISFLTEQAKSLGMLAPNEELVVDEGAPDFETEAQKVILE